MDEYMIKNHVISKWTIFFKSFINDAEKAMTKRVIVHVSTDEYTFAFMQDRRISKDAIFYSFSSHSDGVFKRIAEKYDYNYECSSENIIKGKYEGPSFFFDVSACKNPTYVVVKWKTGKAYDERKF